MSKSNQAPQSPRVVFVRKTALCVLCGPYCQAEHPAFFEFYDAYGTKKFECCSGCIHILGQEYQRVVDAQMSEVMQEAMEEGAATHTTLPLGIQESLMDIPGLDTF